jgi:hypothetical protein
MLANGAAVGATSAVVGTAVGLAAWLAFAPALQYITNRRVNRFDLPWWAIAAPRIAGCAAPLPHRRRTLEIWGKTPSTC